MLKSSLAWSCTGLEQATTAAARSGVVFLPCPEEGPVFLDLGASFFHPLCFAMTSESWSCGDLGVPPVAEHSIDTSPLNLHSSWVRELLWLLILALAVSPTLRPRWMPWMGWQGLKPSGFSFHKRTSLSWSFAWVIRCYVNSLENTFLFLLLKVSFYKLEQLDHLLGPFDYQEAHPQPFFQFWTPALLPSS